MKHIFFVHTPVTYLGSIAIIEHLNLKKEDAIVFFQSFSNDIATNNALHQSILIDDLFSAQNWLSKIGSLLRNFSITKKFDNLIVQAIRQEQYVAYVPVVTFIHKLLITHPNCVGFNFIEEGLAQYYKEETLESINPVYSKLPWRSSLITCFKNTLQELYLYARGYNFKLLALPFSYSCYHGIQDVKYYGYSKDSFPLANNSQVTILPLISKNRSLFLQASALHLDNSFIWIGDPGIIHYGFSKKAYMQGITQGFIPFLKRKNVNTVFLKFHRDEPQLLRKEVVQLFKINSIQPTVLPDTTMMELQLANASNVTLTGIYSSLLYYGSILGHTSYSVFNFVKHEYSKAIANRNFDFFWKKVHLIENENNTFCN